MKRHSLRVKNVCSPCTACTTLLTVSLLVKRPYRTHILGDFCQLVECTTRFLQSDYQSSDKLVSTSVIRLW
uniref:Uncharacterized protein n=1 Tax=Hyaloperonospora arabidopsidis (strain Emoy2) TaxID=559515 RepID=M4BE70_HYAAE